MSSNRINPRKLHHSKWTAVKPIDGEKHFLVTQVRFDDHGAVTQCLIEAIISHRETAIDWRSLKDQCIWRQGWR